MTNRQRLIELIEQAERKEKYDFLTADLDEAIDMSGGTKISCSMEYLADYLLEHRVIVPPCKVGDTVYKIQYCRCGNPEAFEMKHCHKKETSKTPKVLASVMLLQKGKRLSKNSYMFEYPRYEYKPIGTICYKVLQKPFKLEWLTEIGKTVFLTREEAEKALKELEINA